MPAILDVGTTRSFASHKLAAKLPATIQSITPLITTLLTGKTLATTLAIQIDILTDDFIDTYYCYILPLVNPLVLGNDFCIYYWITLDLV